MLDDKLSEAIIGSAFKVHNTLGFGFLETVYEKSMAVELKERQIDFLLQAPIEVRYRDHVVGQFVADIRCGENLIVELKSVTSISIQHEVQLVNYLVATGIDNGLLINFGPRKVEVKRKFRLNNRA